MGHILEDKHDLVLNRCDQLVGLLVSLGDLLISGFDTIFALLGHIGEGYNERLTIRSEELIAGALERSCFTSGESLLTQLVCLQYI